MSEEEEGKFEYFFELPPELTMIIIDEMEIKDRCRFRQCSRQCNKEATNSRKFRNFVNFGAYAQNNILIYVKYLHIDECYHSFSWHFGTELTGKKYMRYRNVVKFEDVWRIELEDSTNLPLLAFSIFKNILKSHQYRVEELTIVGRLFLTDLKDLDLEIESLNYLKILRVSDIEISQIVSKTRRPLEKLDTTNDGNYEILPSLEMTYQVQDWLLSPRLKLNKEQFMKLSASKIHIHIGHLTIDDICDFIKAWQNGFIRDNFQYCCWVFDKDDIQRYRTDLLARFGATHHHNQQGFGTVVYIKQKRNPAKKAKLVISTGFRIMVL